MQFFITVLFCNATWDEAACWPKTPAGTVAKQPCPPIFSATSGSFAYKSCDVNGRWAATPEYWEGFGYSDYTECVRHFQNVIKEAFEIEEEIQENIDVVTDFNAKHSVSALVMSSLSVAALLASLLCISRVTKQSVKLSPCYIITRYFSVAILLASIAITIKKSVFLSDRSILNKLVLDFSNNYSVLCEVLVAVEEYPCFLGYTWLLIRAHYLYLTTKSERLVGSSFLLYRIAGWGIPLIPVAVWTLTSAFDQTMRCWMVHQLEPIIWILETPKILINVTGIVLSYLAWQNLTHNIGILNKRCCYRRIHSEMLTTVCMCGHFFCILCLKTTCYQILLGRNNSLECLFLIIHSGKGLVVSILTLYFNPYVREYVRAKIRRSPRRSSVSSISEGECCTTV